MSLPGSVPASRVGMPTFKLVVLMATLLSLLAGCALPNPFAGHGSPSPTATPANIHETIVRENQQPGTTSWIIPDGAQ
ncbi:MAG: hypothetical protein ACRDHP_08780, partial [Ktedonobacterales bacterium]